MNRCKKHIAVIIAAVFSFSLLPVKGVLSTDFDPAQYEQQAQTQIGNLIRTHIENDLKTKVSLWGDKEEGPTLEVRKVPVYTFRRETIGTGRDARFVTVPGGGRGRDGSAPRIGGGPRYVWKRIKTGTRDQLYIEGVAVKLVGKGENRRFVPMGQTYQPGQPPTGNQNHWFGSLATASKALEIVDHFTGITGEVSTLILKHFYNPSSALGGVMKSFGASMQKFTTVLTKIKKFFNNAAVQAAMNAVHVAGSFFEAKEKTQKKVKTQAQLETVKNAAWLVAGKSKLSSWKKATEKYGSSVINFRNATTLYNTIHSALGGTKMPGVVTFAERSAEKKFDELYPRMMHYEENTQWYTAPASGGQTQTNSLQPQQPALNTPAKKSVEQTVKKIKKSQETNIKANLTVANKTALSNITMNLDLIKLNSRIKDADSPIKAMQAAAELALLQLQTLQGLEDIIMTRLQDNANTLGNRITSEAAGNAQADAYKKRVSDTIQSVVTWDGGRL